MHLKIIITTTRIDLKYQTLHNTKYIIIFDNLPIQINKVDKDFKTVTVPILEANKPKEVTEDFQKFVPRVITKI